MSETDPKIQKLKLLQDKIANGNIESNIFDESSSTTRNLELSNGIGFNLDQADSHLGLDEETYDKYFDEDKSINDCKNDSNSNQSTKKAFDYAIRILSQRDYSTHKMKEKLKKRGCNQDQITEVIERLNEFNYLRDDEFAGMRIKQLLYKGYSNTYILQKLTSEYLNASESQIEEVRAKCEMSQDFQIENLIQKKLRYKEVPDDFKEKMKLKQKVTAYLVSKGFSFEMINNHLSRHI